MKIDVWQKDMAIIADYAASLGVCTPLFTASIPVYNAARARAMAARNRRRLRGAGEAGR